jgi:hypothetical protein
MERSYGSIPAEQQVAGSRSPKPWARRLALAGIVVLAAVALVGVAWSAERAPASLLEKNHAQARLTKAHLEQLAACPCAATQSLVPADCPCAEVLPNP